MKYFRTLLWLSAGLYTLYTIYDQERRSKRQSGPQTRLEDSGFDVSSQTLANGDQVVRLRGSYENLLQLVNPEQIAKKPPVPDNLDIDSLPSYKFGCPHCGAMSMVGENQWRYQELSRTRGVLDNTTTFLTMCQKCDGFMKCTVDHDD